MKRETGKLFLSPLFPKLFSRPNSATLEKLYLPKMIWEVITSGTNGLHKFLHFLANDSSSEHKTLHGLVEHLVN